MYEPGDVLAHFEGASIFLEATTQHATHEKEDAIYCPCKVCNNNVMYLHTDHEIIREHLVCSGFMDNYFIWSKHGETQLRTESIIDDTEEENMNIDHVYTYHDDGGDQDDVGENDEGLDVEELMQNFAPDVLLQYRNKGFNNFEILNKASRYLLYEKCKGCHKKRTVLRMILELLKLKASKRWSDSSFLPLLELLSKILPKPNGLPTITYLGKKIICLLTLGVEKIHACPNHCILYRKEHEFKDKCPRCNASRYKQNNNIEEDFYNNKRKGRKRKNTAPPDQDNQGSKERKVLALVMWYLSVIDHLKRMFSNAREAQLLLCHVQRKRDGNIGHPADCRQWKHFDLSHDKDFCNNPRDIRFGLTTDGMNSFGEMRNPHSTWPVIMCIYNLLPWLCHR
jgi:hypothetical protein